MPEVINEPIQTELLEQKEIRFTEGGYEYSLIPVYDYQINGLVVSKMDYRIFSIYKYDKVFPMDLCLIWGSNAASKVHRNSSVQFSQDCRWCWANWQGKVEFNLQEISNSHLLVKDNRILKELKNINRGDQVKIKGKLVNVRARLIDNPGRSEFAWHTSTTRADSGAGACEVIYVEDVQMLKEANMFSKVLFRLSSYGISIIVIWSAEFFCEFDLKQFA